MKKQGKVAKVPTPIVVKAEPSHAETLPEAFRDEDITRNRVQHLLEAARGVSLILGALAEQDEIKDSTTICMGLSSVLQITADEVDASYFHSPGALAETLDPEVLTALLKSQLDRLSKRISRADNP